MKRTLKTTVAAAMSLLIAACGGGGSGPVAVAADPLAQVPASASASSAGMARYMSDLAAMPSESREAVAVEGFAPPSRDDTEPESTGA